MYILFIILLTCFYFLKISFRSPGGIFVYTSHAMLLEQKSCAALLLCLRRLISLGDQYAVCTLLSKPRC